MTESKQQNSPVVLLVEDGAIIGLALQDDLEENGFRVAGPFTTCATAMNYLKTTSPDAAILDVELGDGTCWALATELAECGIPFMIYSGHQDTMRPTGLKGVVWIAKPAAYRTILDVLNVMLERERLRRELLAEAQERRQRAAELAKVSDRLEQVKLPSIAAAIRDLSQHNTIRGLEQEAKADTLKPLRRDDDG
jgi:DNA-binding response OmpR family regulator